ncbi:LOW QUALITY PROTEIN: hypothetical protein HID58_059895, partial [Brassica napus]
HIVFFNTTLLLSHRFLLFCFESMANEKFGPHLPTIIEAKHIETLYDLWGIDYAGPFGSAPMTPELRGLIATLRGNPRWLAFTAERIQAAYALPPGENRATPVGPVAPKGHRAKSKLIFSHLKNFNVYASLNSPSMFCSGAREKEALPDRPDESSEKTRRGPTLRSRSQAQSPGLLARPVSVDVPAGGVQRASNASSGSVGDLALTDEIDSPTHRRRYRAREEINCVSSNSPSSELPPLLRVFDEGTSQADPSARISDVQGTFSWRFSYDDEVEGLKGKLVATEAEKVALQTDLDLMKESIGGRLKATAFKERNLARRSLAQEYDAVLAVLKDKLQKKKEETAVEIRLQEVRARIEALTEYSEGGFELEEELVRLKDREISLDLDYGVASVSDPSLSCLDLPEVSDDSVDQ